MTDDIDLSITLEEKHAWNLDSTLASVLAQGLQFLIDGPCEQEDGIDKAQAIFEAYTKRWHSGRTAIRYETPGTKEHTDLEWALEWLKQNFASLWD